MKKIFLFLLTCSFVLSACGNNKNYHINEKDTLNIKGKLITEEDATIENISDKKEENVEIVLGIYQYGEDVDIQQYVNELNIDSEQENYVYDESHYAYLTTKNEQEKYLKEICSEEYKNEFINSLNSSYPDVFKDAIFLNYGKDAELYVSKENYQNSDFGVSFVAILVTSSFQDIIQAYNLIELNEREYNINIFDFETNELIYSTENESGE